MLSDIRNETPFQEAFDCKKKKDSFLQYIIWRANPISSKHASREELWAILTPRWCEAIKKGLAATVVVHFSTQLLSLYFWTLRQEAQPSSSQMLWVMWTVFIIMKIRVQGELKRVMNAWKRR